MKKYFYIAERNNPAHCCVYINKAGILPSSLANRSIVMRNIVNNTVALFFAVAISAASFNTLIV